MRAAAGLGTQFLGATMKFSIIIAATLSLTVISCSPAAEDAPAAKPVTKAKSTLPTDDAVPPPASCVPSAANNNCAPLSAMIDKCWAKILDTPEAKACASSGKLYNRVQKKCVDAGIKLKSGCSVPPADLKTAQDKIIAKLGADSNPQIDQCGSYSLNGSEFLVVYVMGKKYTGNPDGFGAYAHENSLLCYRPDGGSNPVCPSPDLALSTGGSAPGSLTCD